MTTPFLKKWDYLSPEQQIALRRTILDNIEHYRNAAAGLHSEGYLHKIHQHFRGGVEDAREYVRATFMELGHEYAINWIIPSKETMNDVRVIHLLDALKLNRQAQDNLIEMNRVLGLSGIEPIKVNTAETHNTLRQLLRQEVNKKIV